MSKQMLINTVEGHECRIAILDAGRLEELYTERASSASQVGNIYKGKITNIEPSIQAAFIDFGDAKNGFLHVSDLHPKFFPKSSKTTEQVGRRSSHRSRPPIQECLKRGQEIVVQMIKQGIGTKGPAMTTYLSIPGRLLVTMPGMTHVGISRKIEDEEVRSHLRGILDQLEIPKDMGVIVRTAGVDRTKRDMQRDLSYLARLWKSIDKRIEKASAPCEIYQESNLVLRTLRDIYNSDIDRIICDSESVTLGVKEFLDVAVPRAKCKLELYSGRKGLFEEFNVEDEIRKIHSRQVELEKGGSLVIDQTEALVAIDVNSGNFRAHNDPEQNALKLNLIAAEEVARQLHLRDMGGVIVIDFIDMRDDKNRRALEKKMRDLLKNDRAKSKVLRISNFGLVEMTRQRLRPSLKQSLYSRCPHCDGAGQIMSEESVALRVMRSLHAACANPDVTRIEIAVSPRVAHHLLNTQRQSIAGLELRTEKDIVITAQDELTGNDVQITCKNARGSQVAWDKQAAKDAKNAQAEFIDIKDILKGKRPAKKSAPAAKQETSQQADDQASSETSEQTPAKKTRKRGRRGGRNRKKKTTVTTEATATTEETTTDADDNAKDTETAEAAGNNTTRKSALVRTSSENAILPVREADEELAQLRAEATQNEALDEQPEQAEQANQSEQTDSAEPSEPAEKTEPETAKKKTRRRGKRGGRKHRKKNTGETPAQDQTKPADDMDS